MVRHLVVPLHLLLLQYALVLLVLLLLEGELLVLPYPVHVVLALYGAVGGRCVWVYARSA